MTSWNYSNKYVNYALYIHMHWWLHVTHPSAMSISFVSGHTSHAVWRHQSIDLFESVWQTGAGIVSGFVFDARLQFGPAGLQFALLPFSFHSHSCNIGLETGLITTRMSKDDIKGKRMKADEDNQLLEIMEWEISETIYGNRSRFDSIAEGSFI